MPCMLCGIQVQPLTFLSQLYEVVTHCHYHYRYQRVWSCQALPLVSNPMLYSLQHRDFTGMMGWQSGCLALSSTRLRSHSTRISCRRLVFFPRHCTFQNRASATARHSGHPSCTFEKNHRKAHHRSIGRQRENITWMLCTDFCKRVCRCHSDLCCKRHHYTQEFAYAHVLRRSSRQSTIVVLRLGALLLPNKVTPFNSFFSCHRTLTI